MKNSNFGYRSKEINKNIQTAQLSIKQIDQQILKQNQRQHILDQLIKALDDKQSQAISNSQISNHSQKYPVYINNQNQSDSGQLNQSLSQLSQDLSFQIDKIRLFMKNKTQSVNSYGHQQHYRHNKEYNKKNQHRQHIFSRITKDKIREQQLQQIFINNQNNKIENSRQNARFSFINPQIKQKRQNQLKQQKQLYEKQRKISLAEERNSIRQQLIKQHKQKYLKQANQLQITINMSNKTNRIFNINRQQNELKTQKNSINYFNSDLSEENHGNKKLQKFRKYINTKLCQFDKTSLKINNFKHQMMQARRLASKTFK